MNRENQDINKKIRNRKIYTGAMASDSTTKTLLKMKHESPITIALQTLFPFLLAGLGMVGTGIYLDKVQHWKVFQGVPELFIIVPALLGLKGNLEMTLASRLSSYANQGYLDDPKKSRPILWANIVTVEAQAAVVAFSASLLAMSLSSLTANNWKTEHVLILCSASLLTSAIASALLGLIMIAVIVNSRKYGINPDNVATPIAAALGDIITLSLLANISQVLYSEAYNPTSSWLVHIILAAFLLSSPILVWLSYNNMYSKHIIIHGWLPVLSAMAISSAGGLILNLSISHSKDIAMFVPVVNGVGGNLVAIQASRISSYLHTSGYRMGRLPEDHALHQLPWKAYSSGNRHAVGARVMLSMVLPGQIIFLFAIAFISPGHNPITPSFVVIYLLISFVQVGLLLQLCNWLVFRLWRLGKDPDNCAIPYLTGLGDFIGTSLLAIAFYFVTDF